MNATSLYVSTCRLVLQANPEDPGCWADLYRLIPYLRQSLSCTVCGNLLIEPYTPTETNCQHHVCRSCKGGKKKLKPSCSWCKNYDKYVENVQLRILLQCYKKLCEYVINSSIYRLMCKTTASGDTNIANMTDLIQEGAGFKDEFKSNSGLSKSAYSILPCIYASASTQTITQAINLNNDSEIAIDEDVSVAKSNLSNGSSIYSVTYAGSGNKMVIKRKAMLNKGEMENCENLRLIKGSSFKRPIHRRGNFRGRGRGFKDEEKTNSTGVSNCTVSSNNVNSGRVNVKKKKLGCRCGNATASPGKLTCCGQRCPCYVDSKACLDCKCRGCRNPHTKEGQKVIRDPIDSNNSKLQSTAQLQSDEGIPAETENLIDENSPCFNENATRDFPTKLPKQITITVQSIENVDESKVKEVMVSMEFSEKLLIQSGQTTIINNRADIDLTAYITVEEMSPEFINEILCNPVLFTVVDCTIPSPLPTEMSSSLNVDKETKRKTSKSSAQTLISKSVMSNNGILGLCNLDMGNFIAGEKRIKESLLVESDKMVPPNELLPWKKLPRLEVLATTGDEPLLPESSTRVNTIASITVESVYNAPEYLSEGVMFDATMLFPAGGDKSNWIKFPNGVVTKKKDFTCRKKWINLSHVVGLGARSTKHASAGTYNIISNLPELENLENAIMASEKFIQWNIWRNCLMSEPDTNFFFLKIMKYHVWPIDIVLSNRSFRDSPPKNKSAKSDKKSKGAPPTNPGTTDHFTAFLDLSPLLYPGATKIRVGAQLLTYSAADFSRAFGSDIGIFLKQSITSFGTAKSKTSERSKGSESKDMPGQPVVNDYGEPTFIVVEIEFSKPFYPTRKLNIIEKTLKDCLSLKSIVKKKKTTERLMMNDFSQSILDAVNTLIEEYYEFNNEVLENNLTKKFHEYLKDKKNFSRIKITVQNKIVDLIREKFGGMENYEKILPEVYIFLVNEMYKVTNQLSLKEDIPSTYSSDLQFYAEEAFDEGDYNIAKDYLYLKLSKNTANPDNWLDLAVFYIKLKSWDEAIEAVREALCLDFQHQMGLLMYALLMNKISNESPAEMAFQVLLSKYTDFIEGWIILRFFYISIDNTGGAVAAFRQAKELANEIKTKEQLGESSKSGENEEFSWRTYLEQDKYQPAREEKYGMGSFKRGISWTEPLSWTISICPPGNFNLRTIILLQKLGFYDFASLILCKEFSCKENEDRNPPYYAYYTSVNLYLQGCYEEAILLLQSYTKKYGKDIFMWSLLGHCFYKLENHSKALSFYEFVLQSYNRPDDCHLIYYRMGLYYLKTNKFSCTKQILTTACQYSPTPRLWKTLGMACLLLEDLDDAEIVFTEANYLDSKDPDTWAYLAITNSMLGKLDLFKKCCIEAKKRGLKNSDLRKKIKSCAISNGISDEEIEY